MFERRRIQRTRVLKGVKIILNDRSSLFDCTVRNLTNLGASVHVPSTIGIPDVFALTFDSGRSSRGCRVIWRANDRLGVSFV
jgi:hypothetical protein